MLVNNVARHGSPSGGRNDTAVRSRWWVGTGRSIAYTLTVETTRIIREVECPHLVSDTRSPGSSDIRGFVLLSSSGPSHLGPHQSHMTDSTTVYLPRSVGEFVDDVHQRAGRPGDPKWRTVERAINQFDDGDTNE